MKQKFGLIRRAWRVFYAKNKITCKQTTLKTKSKDEALWLLVAMNQAEQQPAMNLSLARVYAISFLLRPN
jgi:hypothetical protein